MSYNARIARHDTQTLASAMWIPLPTGENRMGIGFDEKYMLEKHGIWLPEQGYKLLAIHTLQRQNKHLTLKIIAKYIIYFTNYSSGHTIQGMKREGPRHNFIAQTCTDIWGSGCLIKADEGPLTNIDLK